MAPVQTPARILVGRPGPGLGDRHPLLTANRSASLGALRARWAWPPCSAWAGARAWRPGGNLWLLAPARLSSPHDLRAGQPTLTVLNRLALLGLLGLLVYFYAARRLGRLGLLGYPTVLAWSARTMVLEPVAPVAGVRAAVRPTRAPGAGLAPRAARRGPGPAGAVRLRRPAGLRRQRLRRLLGDMLQLELPDQLPELALAAGAHRRGRLDGRRAACSMPCAAARARRPGAAVRPARSAPAFSLGFVEGATVLALVNALFLVFNWIQVRTCSAARPRAPWTTRPTASTCGAASANCWLSPC